jgi:hypothetical protein
MASRPGSSLSGDGMGLLDDAIREHLELKKKHGADLAEVERQEREALGASRQAEFAAADEDGPGPEEPAAEEAEDEAAEAAEAVDPVDAGDEQEPFDVEALEPAEEEPQVPEAGDTAGAPGYDEDPWLEEERDEVPAGESLDRPREPASEEEGEDVLEDTPDFLQETPEHDRLWFEQKPPRDFDWDK